MSESAALAWMQKARPVLDRAWANLGSDWRGSEDSIDFGHDDADAVAADLGPLLTEMESLLAGSNTGAAS